MKENKLNGNNYFVQILVNKQGNIMTTVITVFSHLQMKLKFKFNLRLKSLLNFSSTSF